MDEIRPVGYVRGMQPQPLLKELIDLESRGWEALCDGTGADFYGRLVTDDGLMVLANGSVMNRHDVVAALKESPTWGSYSIDQPSVIRVGEDSAALVYVGTGFRDGEKPLAAVMTSVYVRHSGEWKLAVFQQTPRPDDA